MSNAQWLTKSLVRSSGRLARTALASVTLAYGAAWLISNAQGAPKTVAFLTVHLQNDNEGLEPTTDAERARMAALERSFKDQLEASGEYTFVSVPAAVEKKIANGQTVGTCGACEADYGKEAGAEQVAWIRVQKVSNLILNLNVYMESVANGKLTYEHSVDIRGNTDESWSRSLTYLIKNYLLTAKPSG
jgi:Protein of unknown function (DUF2380)